MTRAWRNTATRPTPDMRYAALRGTADRRHHRRSQLARAWWIRVIQGDNSAIPQAYAYRQLAQEAAMLAARLTVARQVRQILEAQERQEQTR